LELAFPTAVGITRHATVISITRRFIEDLS
jgi:hypothetical protein